MDGTQLTEELTRPEAYLHEVERVGFRQTHISRLFFAGDRVYKVKKPVDLGFLDFTDLDRRRHFCEEEVRLNRRLAPQVYLGVVPITAGEDGHLRIGGEGEAIEWAVEMARLPEHRMFSAMLERGEIDNARMNAMVDLLVDFHESAPTGSGVDEHGRLFALMELVEGNFLHLREFAGDPEDGEDRLRVLSPTQLGFLRERAHRFLSTQADLVRRRIRQGRIREGHGDLHAGNLCFAADGIVAYDCIEFSRRLRCGDVAADLGFLAMDLDQRGYPGFSGYLARRYAEVSGDESLVDMLGFYKAYRALVRAKVAALTAADVPPGDPERVEHAREAMRYVQLAAAYDLPPTMILTCGLPASGKTWLARRLARPLRATLLRSDVRRKVLAGITPMPPGDGSYGTGRYAPHRRESVYRSLLESTLEPLRAGHSVIVDATFSRRAYRRDFIDAAARLGLPFQVLHVTAPEGVIRARLERRREDPTEASEADLEVYRREREAFEPPTEVPEKHLLEVSSGIGLPEEESSAVVDRLIALEGG